VAVWPKLVVTERVRVLGVDTPESGDAAAQATAFTKAWLAEGLIEIMACKYDAFGRILGRVTKRGHGSLDAALLMAGHGRPR
jgi:endonuclease YncB( thermonuclease family)